MGAVRWRPKAYRLPASELRKGRGLAGTSENLTPALRTTTLRVICYRPSDTITPLALRPFLLDAFSDFRASRPLPTLAASSTNERISVAFSSPAPLPEASDPYLYPIRKTIPPDVGSHVPDGKPGRLVPPLGRGPQPSLE